MPQSENIQCELLVIGAGMAGAAASLFAARRKISTVQVGAPAEIIYASGLLDVLGVYPPGQARQWRSPWRAIERLRRDTPLHPYARLNNHQIRSAVDEFIRLLADAALPYRRLNRRNVDVLTPVGSLKRTYAVPESMWAGVLAWREKRACLLIDFRGLKGYSARQIQSVLQARWPRLRAARISFPDLPPELYPERMAQALEVGDARRKLGAAILPHLEAADTVGLPAICGIHRPSQILAHLRDIIGVPVFEVPIMPPSVTGLRLKNAFERLLPQNGVRTLHQKKVLGVRRDHRGRFIFDIGGTESELSVQAEAAILASGRFIGQGLRADRHRIRETIFDLPVFQPAGREHWHRGDFFDRRGHAVNQAGLEIDESFRPLNGSGHPVFPNLYAAGSILAHADWLRMKCGSGLAIASACGAVNALLKHRRQMRYK
jgi:glycerol-3-phosphate dehydrogenase subunit B